MDHGLFNWPLKKSGQVYVLVGFCQLNMLTCFLNFLSHTLVFTSSFCLLVISVFLSYSSNDFGKKSKFCILFSLFLLLIFFINFFTLHLVLQHFCVFFVFKLNFCLFFTIFALLLTHSRFFFILRHINLKNVNKKLKKKIQNCKNWKK